MNLDNSIFTEREKIVGYIGTDSGGIMLTDALWETELPATTLDRMAVDLGIQPGRIPVIAGMRNGKRFLIIDIDGAQVNEEVTDDVDTEGTVALPKETKDGE